MARYVVGRLLLFIPTVMGLAIIVFILVRLIPGDAVDARVGDAYVDPQVQAAMRHDLGLDRPAAEQFWTWTSNAVRGNLGTSLVQQRPVLTILGERLPRTIELTLVSAILAVSIGIIVGVISAIRQETLLDYLLRIITIGGISLPTFVTGVLVLYFLVTVFQWSPPLGFKSLFADPRANVMQIALPSLVLAYWTAAPIARMARSQMLEVIHQDYIRTARAKGLKDGVVVYRHAIRNAVLPVITLAGVQVGRLLSGVVIVESIFSVPGVGTGIVSAVSQRDYPLVQAYVLVVALMFVSINLLVDLMYGLIDPRIRYG